MKFFNGLILASLLTATQVFAGGGGLSTKCADGTHRGGGMCKGERKIVFLCEFTNGPISAIRQSYTTFQNFPQENYGVSEVFSSTLFPTLHWNRGRLSSQELSSFKYKIADERLPGELILNANTGTLSGDIQGHALKQRGTCKLLGKY